MKTWMRRRGDLVMIINGKYAGHKGTVESNGHQRSVDHPGEWHNWFHVMLDTEVLVTVRWDGELDSDGRLACGYPGGMTVPNG